MHTQYQKALSLILLTSLLLQSCGINNFLGERRHSIVQAQKLEEGHWEVESPTNTKPSSPSPGEVQEAQRTGSVTESGGKGVALPTNELSNRPSQAVVVHRLKNSFPKQPYRTILTLRLGNRGQHHRPNALEDAPQLPSICSRANAKQPDSPDKPSTTSMLLPVHQIEAHTFKAVAGQTVRFQRQGNTWTALVQEPPFPGCMAPEIKCSIVMERGMELEEILGKLIQRPATQHGSYIEVATPQQTPWTHKKIVRVSHRGLKGGVLRGARSSSVLRTTSSLFRANKPIRRVPFTTSVTQNTGSAHGDTQRPRAPFNEHPQIGDAASTFTLSKANRIEQHRHNTIPSLLALLGLGLTSAMLYDAEESVGSGPTQQAHLTPTAEQTREEIATPQEAIDEKCALLFSLDGAPTDTGLVAGLFADLERLLEHESTFTSEEGKASARDYLLELKEKDNLGWTEEQYDTIIQLLEKAYGQELKRVTHSASRIEASSRSRRLLKVLGELAALHQERGDRTGALSCYTDAAILYQHVLTVCDKEQAHLEDTARQGQVAAAYEHLAQVKGAMLSKILDKEVAVSAEELYEEIKRDKRDWHEWREKVKAQVDLLKEAEKSSNDELYIRGTRALFEDIAQHMQDRLAKLYEEAEALLGPAPCRYTVVGLGSMALRQITPYSDLEFCLLIEESQNPVVLQKRRAYFRQLSHLVNLRIINLGESVMRTSEYGVNFAPIGQRGVNFDLGGKTPLGRMDRKYDLIQTVEGMMSYLRNEGRQIEKIDKLLPFILDCTCLVHGDKTLYERYEREKQAFLQRPEVHQNRYEQVLVRGGGVAAEQTSDLKTSFQGSLEAFTPRLSSDHMGQLYDVKQEIYRLPDRLLYQLARYYGLQAQSGWDAVDKLYQAGIIGLEAAMHLHYATSFATLLRLRTYAHYGYQQETMTALDPVASQQEREQALADLFKPFPTVLQEDGSLFRYYYVALPLHERMVRFFEQRQKQRQRDFFSADAFYDSSPAVKGAIHERLLRYASAKTCYQQAVEEHRGAHLGATSGPSLARALDSLGRAHAALGEEQSALERRKEALALCRTLYGDNALEVAEARTSVGKSYEASGHTRKALKYFQKALHTIESLDEQHRCAPEILARYLSHVGECHHNLGEKEQALSSFEKALKRYQAIYGAQAHWALARAYDNVGLAYEALGETNKGLAYKITGLEMMKTLYPGQHHPYVAHCLHSVGCAYEAMDAVSQGIDYKEEALAMLRTLHPARDHTQLALWLDSLGSSYYAIGKKQKGLDYKREGLRMLKALYGSQDHWYVARALCSVGSTCVEMRRTREGLGLLQESLELLKKLHQGRPHRDLVACYESLAAGYESLGMSYWNKEQQYRNESSKMRRALHDECPESLQQLKEHYLKRYTYLLPFVEDEIGMSVYPMEHVQFHLVLSEQRKRREDLPIAQEKHTPYREPFNPIKFPMALEGLFRPRNVAEEEPVQEIQRVLLTGGPGAGKTTLSQKLAYLWARGQWDSAFDVVYVLPVRELRQQDYTGAGLYSEETLQAAIANTCFSIVRGADDYKQLLVQLADSLQQPSTLVVLDGLDERYGVSRAILEQAYQGPHKLLILSRPYMMEREQRLADREVELMGFSDECIEHYARHYFPKEETGQAFMNFLREHPAVKDIAQVPVNLHMLCALWHNEPSKVQDIGASLTRLYTELTEYAWDRYIYKYLGAGRETTRRFTNDERDELFKVLGTIALKTKKKCDTKISRDSVNEALKKINGDKRELDPMLLESGFLQRISAHYQFMHQTFLDYFAGRTLAARSWEELRPFLEQHQHKAQYIDTLAFMGGLISETQGVQGIREFIKLSNEVAQQTEKQSLKYPLLLQLRLLNEWLCIPNENLEEQLVSLNRDFKLVGKLQQLLDSELRSCQEDPYYDPSEAIVAASLLLKRVPDNEGVAVLSRFLIDKFRTGDSRLHSGASLALASLVQAVPESAEELLENLKEVLGDSHGDASQIAVILTLGELAQSSEQVNRSILPVLEKILENKPSDDIRAAISLALGDLMQKVQPQEARRVMESLKKRLGDLNAGVRAAAGLALGNFVQAVPDKQHEVFGFLKGIIRKTEENDTVRAGACRALGYCATALPQQEDGPSELIINEVLAFLSEVLGESQSNSIVRSAASLALGCVVQAAPPKADRIFELLQRAAFNAPTNEVETRRAASMALGDLVQAVPGKAREVKEVLQKVLEDNSACRNEDLPQGQKKQVRAGASWALGSLVKADPQTGREVLTLLEHSIYKQSGAFTHEDAKWIVGDLVQVLPKEVREKIFKKLSAKPMPFKGAKPEEKSYKDARSTLEEFEKIAQTKMTIPRPAQVSIDEVKKALASSIAISFVQQDDPLQKNIEEVIELLRETLQYREVTVRACASRALIQLIDAAPKQSVEKVLCSLQADLSSPDVNIRQGASWAFADLVENASEIEQNYNNTVKNDSDTEEKNIIKSLLSSLQNDTERSVSRNKSLAAGAPYQSAYDRTKHKATQQPYLLCTQVKYHLWRRMSRLRASN